MTSRMDKQYVIKPEISFDCCLSGYLCTKLVITDAAAWIKIALRVLYLVKKASLMWSML